MDLDSTGVPDSSPGVSGIIPGVSGMSSSSDANSSSDEPVSDSRDCESFIRFGCSVGGVLGNCLGDGEDDDFFGMFLLAMVEVLRMLLPRRTDVDWVEDAVSDAQLGRLRLLRMLLLRRTGVAASLWLSMVAII